MLHLCLESRGIAEDPAHSHISFERASPIREFALRQPCCKLIVSMQVTKETEIFGLPLMEMARWNRFLAEGVMSSCRTEVPPEDCPHIVTLEGSPK
jgi:hypothetical protein